MPVNRPEGRDCGVVICIDRLEVARAHVEFDILFVTLTRILSSGLASIVGPGYCPFTTSMSFSTPSGAPMRSSTTKSYVRVVGAWLTMSVDRNAASASGVLTCWLFVVFPVEDKGGDAEEWSCRRPRPSPSPSASPNMTMIEVTAPMTTVRRVRDLSVLVTVWRGGSWSCGLASFGSGVSAEAIDMARRREGEERRKTYEQQCAICTDLYHSLAEATDRQGVRAFR